MPDQLPSDDGSAACDFFDLWLDDRDRGVTRPLSEYLSRFPGSEEVIAREFLALRDDEARKSNGLLPAAEPIADRAGSFGPYVILRELGRGGQGVIHLAEDPRLKRLVALKVLDADAMPLGPARAARLRREAEALAKLDHPGIAAIFDADLEGPHPWFAMRYVPGETLAARIARVRRGEVVSGLKGPLASGQPQVRAGLSEILRFIEQAARALHAAHEAGVIHRDVKPGNLMIDDDGRPIVLDFGLARDENPAVPGLTVSSEVLGTIAYTTPEQIEGAPDLDRRVDVYALGVTLFEALTLRRPFEAPTREALLHAILDAAPSNPSHLNPLISRDLRVVITTAMERDRGRRYASALLFAEDLARVIAGEPVLARPPGPWRRARLFGRRHPVTATALVAVIFALAAGLGATIAFLARLEREDRSLRALRQAHVARSLAERQPAEALRMAIEAARQETHPEINGILYEILESCHEETTFDAGSGPSLVLSDGPTTDLQGLTAACGAADGSVRLVPLKGDGGAVTFRDPAMPHSGRTIAHFAPAGRLLASGFQDGTVLVWDLARESALLRSFAPAAGGPESIGVRWLEWSRDGKILVAGGDGGLIVLDLAANRPRFEPVETAGGLTLARIDRSGQRALIVPARSSLGGAFGETSIRILDLQSGTAIREFGPLEGPLPWAEWSEDGNRFLVADDKGKVTVGTPDGSTVATLRHESRVYWAAFDRDGGRIITGSADGLVVWDVASLSIEARHADFGDRSVIRGAFSPDRERLAVVSWDGTAAVFDCATWTMQARLKGHQTRPRGISWSMDGQRVITSEENALLHVWYPGRRPFAPVFDGHHGRVTTVAFTPDDSGILSVSNDTVRSFERSTGQIRFSITSRRSIAGMRAGIDGGRFIIFGATGLAEVYSSHDGALLAGLDAGKYPITNALFFDGGARAVTVAEDGQVRIHDVASTRSLKTISAHPGPIASAAIHEGRRWLATGGSDRTIRIFDIDSGAAVFASTPWPGPERGLDPLGHVFDVAFDAAGARLYAACEDQVIRIFECQTGFGERRIESATPGRLLLDPRGRRLYCSFRWMGRIGSFDLDVGRPFSWPNANFHSNLITALATSGDGRLLLTASKDGRIALWHTDPPRFFGAIHAGAMVLDATFSKDGGWILAGLSNGTIRLWPTDPFAVAERYCPRLR